MGNIDLLLDSVIEYPGSGSRVVADFTQRDDLGRPEEILLDDNVSTGSQARIQQSLDAMGRISTLDLTSRTGKTHNRAYHYDDRGRLGLLETTTVIGTTTTIEDINYLYDEPGWLVKEIRSDGTAVVEQETYTDDAAGNRTGYDLEDGASNPIQSVGFTYSAGDLLSSRTESSTTP